MKAQIWSIDIILAILGMIVVVVTLSILLLPRGGQQLGPAVQNTDIVRSLSGKADAQLLRGNVLDPVTLGKLALMPPQELKVFYGTSSAFCVVLKDSQGKIKHVRALVPKGGKTEAECRTDAGNCDEITVCSFGAPTRAVTSGDDTRVKLRTEAGLPFICGEKRGATYGCPP